MFIFLLLVQFRWGWRSRSTPLVIRVMLTRVPCKSVHWMSRARNLSLLWTHP